MIQRRSEHEHCILSEKLGKQILKIEKLGGLRGLTGSPKDVLHLGERVAVGCGCSGHVCEYWLSIVQDMDFTEDGRTPSENHIW